MIGSAIVEGLSVQGAKVINIDIKTGLDLGNLTSRKVEVFAPNIFINASYPKNYLTHARLFQKYTEKLAQYMSQNGGGSIINIASIYGMVAPRYWIYEGTNMTVSSDYAGLKAGIISMSRCLAAKYAKDNVRINTISPGGLWDNQPESFVKNYCKLTPMGRMGKPQDIVGTVIFLASNASAYITGVNIPIDGGFTA